MKCLKCGEVDVWSRFVPICDACEHGVLMHQSEDEEKEEECNDYIVVCVTPTTEHTIHLVASSLLDAVKKAVIPDGAVITKAYLHEDEEVVS